MSIFDFLFVGRKIDALSTLVQSFQERYMTTTAELLASMQQSKAKFEEGKLEIVAKIQALTDAVGNASNPDPAIVAAAADLEALADFFSNLANPVETPAP